MKKSIIIIGSQGSGKTQELNKLLKNCQKPFIEMSFAKFQIAVKSKLKEKFEVVGIDEIATVEQLEYLVNVSNVNQTLFVATSQLNVKDLPQIIVSKFDVVQMRTAQ